MRLSPTCLSKRIVISFRRSSFFSNKCADIIDGSVKDTNTATHTHKKSCISLTKSFSHNTKSYRSLAEISAKIEDQTPSTPCKEDSMNILSFTDTDFPTGKLQTTFPKHNPLQVSTELCFKRVWCRFGFTKEVPHG
eukprot:11780654-Ditylum_brightwellii.AAC.1